MIVPDNFRVGYACICTELRKNDIFASRTLRLATLKKKGLDYVKDLALQNLRDLLTILKWNKENEIYFMRLSSEMFPFASHLEHGYTLDFADSHLKEIGKYARDNNMRLTMHPGQYDVLSSPNKSVIANTSSDLIHHCDILDRMGMGRDSVMIIHGGGVYGDKEKSLKRLEENFLNLPKNVQDRLVLENCEMSYCLEDLINISEKLQIPIVIDMHHDSIYPSSNPVDFYYERIFKVWFNKGIKPKVHVSNSVPGIKETDNKTMRRKHSDYIQFLHEPLLKIKFPIDVMLECKMKEQAIFKLRKACVSNQGTSTLQTNVDSTQPHDRTKKIEYFSNDIKNCEKMDLSEKFSTMMEKFFIWTKENEYILEDINDGSNVEWGMNLLDDFKEP